MMSKAGSTLSRKDSMPCGGAQLCKVPPQPSKQQTDSEDRCDSVRCPWLP